MNFAALAGYQAQNIAILPFWQDPAAQLASIERPASNAASAIKWIAC
jgi:hypothetical protein